MISLETIGTTLETLLNHSTTGVDKPSTLIGYQFVVRTQGFFFRKIADLETGKNFIPVFIGSLGGNINPVPSLEEVNYNVPITVYFPVRFKDDMFVLQDFLYNLFVGQQREYGSQYALSNISIPQIGEIQYLDLKEFKQWLNDTYKRDIVVNEPWLSMTFTLYLSSAKNVLNGGFVYGNSWGTSIAIYDENTTVLEDDDPTFVEITDNSSSEPSAQQILDTEYTTGRASATSYSRQIMLYVTNKYDVLIRYYLDRKLQGLRFVMEDECSDFNLDAEKIYYIVGCNLKKAKGELITMTFTLADRMGA